MKITFLGAAGEVTGSQHLIETESLRILLDCGLFQGAISETRPKNERFLCSPRKLDLVVLSHAHIDHCGNLPGLYKAGFRGPILCTAATAEIARAMMRDSARIQEEDARYAARKKWGHSSEPVEPLYSEDDAKAVSKLFEHIPFGEWVTQGDHLRIRLHQAGHILGAAVVELEIQDGEEWKRLVFTGDLGRRDVPLLPDPETVERCDVVISEATYGDRLHPESGDVKARLQEVICDASRRQGKVVIPAFSLGRTQMLIYLLNELRNENAMCRVPVYVDSPLALRLTDIYRDHTTVMDDEAKATLHTDDDIFDFEGLTYIRSQDESMALNRKHGPFVVIAAGGMCENGRVVHHLKHTVAEQNNTVLIIGFQAQHSLGRQIVERPDHIHIHGKRFPLNCHVEIINGLSAHADAADFKWWFGALERSGGAGQVFLVHGESRAMEALAEIAASCSDLPVIQPNFGESFEV